MADHPFLITLHMGAGHHSRKLEHKYKEGGAPRWHLCSAFCHVIVSAAVRLLVLQPSDAGAVPAVMAAAARQGKVAMHAPGGAMAAVQAAPRSSPAAAAAPPGPWRYQRSCYMLLLAVPSHFHQSPSSS